MPDYSAEDIGFGVIPDEGETPFFFNQW